MNNIASQLAMTLLILTVVGGMLATLVMMVVDFLMSPTLAELKAFNREMILNLFKEPRMGDEGRNIPKKKPDDDAAARETDPQSSHDAAKVVQATKLEAVVLEALTRYGEMTSIEVADKVRISPWSISPRFKPMEKKGYIERTGERRKNPHTGKGKGLDVWRIKEIA